MAQVPSLGVYLINGSPRVTNDSVEAEFQITRPVAGVRCFLRSQFDRIWQKCEVYQFGVLTERGSALYIYIIIYYDTTHNRARQALYVYVYISLYSLYILKPIGISLTPFQQAHLVKYHSLT